MKTRVWCLYRVSTKKQANTDEDIPMQKSACEHYVSQKGGWEITHELFERGVSGWKKKVDERDALNEIREGAVNGDFDVLLVYMFDRLGRREDETPLVVNFLHENNVEVWSVEEGKKSMGNHVDKLINYISFWQSSGESIKTSMRVRESKKQLSQNGMYQGGTVPFGYQVYETDQPHWKDQERMIKELKPEEYESEIVKLIFDLYLNHNYGYRRIVDYLNSKGYKNRNNTLFRVNTVSRILENPIYIGKKRYKSHDGNDGDTQPYDENLRIISDESYFDAQKLRKNRSNKLKPQDKSNLPMKGKLLLSGQVYCGYCGSKLSSNYLYRKNKHPKKEGEYYTNTIYRYRCPLNNGRENHKQSIWGSKKHDKLVMDTILFFINNIDLDSLTNNGEKYKESRLNVKRQSIKNLEKESDRLSKQKEKLNAEISKSLVGESAFSPEQLSNAINDIEGKIEEVESNFKELQIEVDAEEKRNDEVEEIVDAASKLKNEFEELDDDTKKVIISKLTEKIYFYKDEVKVMFIPVLQGETSNL